MSGCYTISTIESNPDDLAIWKVSSVGRIFSFLQRQVHALDGQCIISGSFSLYLYQWFSYPKDRKMLFNPQDVDIYILNVDSKVIMSLITIFSVDNHDISICKCDTYEGIEYPGSKLRAIINYCCWKKSYTICRKLQIIVWEDKLVSSVSPSEFANMVTSQYDISVVKTAIINSESLNQFFLWNDEVERDIKSKMYSYTIRQNSCQRKMMQRMNKYESRGFEIYKYTFEKCDLVLHVLKPEKDTKHSKNETCFCTS
jgi:hypothetical protein